MRVIRNGVKALRQFFKPTLVEHVPGQKRVYQNLLGTRTTYSLKKSDTLVPVVDKSYGKIEIFGKNFPKDMLTEDVIRTGDRTIPLDTPIKETFFTKAKTYLFGLIKGKRKTMETINIGDRVIARGEMNTTYQINPNEQKITKQRWCLTPNEEVIFLPNKCVINENGVRKVVF